MTAAQDETIGQWLERLAQSDVSTEQDSRRMQNMLRRVGFPEAVVVVGIVYPKGRGTLDFPPMPVQQMAKVLVEKAKAAR